MADKQKQYVFWMHLAGLSGYLGLPLGHILVPLIFWLMKRRESSWIDQQGKEILNFQITVTFYYIFSYILVSILIGFLFLAVVFLLHVISMIVAAVRVNDGQKFFYPASLRILK